MRPSVCSSTSWRTRSSGMLRALATRGTWNSAASGEMCGIEAAARGRHQIDRDRGRRDSPAFSLSTSPLHAIDQRLVGRAEIRAAGIGGVVGRVARSWSDPSGRARSVADGRPWKYLSLGEDLADQRGADDLAVLLDQAALRLVGEDHAGDAGHRQRIGQAGDQRQRDDEDDRRADFLQHGLSPQARCKAVTTRSMALMPMNGMMMPPRP